MSRAGADEGAWPLVAQRIVLLAALAPFALPALVGHGLAGATVASMALIGASTAVATTAFLVAAWRDGLTIVAAVGGLAPVVVAVLARVFLHETWTRRQLLALNLAVAGVVLIALALR